MNKRLLILLFFVLAKFVLQYLLIDGSYDLHRDEYLHLDQAKHLAWGYESVPPLTSWISYIILKLGNTVFWVKFFPALFGALTIIVVWKTATALNGSLFSLVLASTAILLSAILRLNILYQPNSFDVLAWTAFYYTLIRYIQSEENKWLYYTAVVFAFGFLNKYNIVFLLIGTIPALLLTSYRRVFTNKHLYFAVILALVIVLPNLIWQFKNNLPVVHHMKELADTQLVNVNRGDFLKEQLIYFIGSIFMLVAAWVSYFVFKPHYKFRLLFFSLVCTLVLFIYLRAKGYYAIGLYPVHIAVGAVYLGYLLQNSWKRYLQPVAFLIILFFSITFIRIGFPTAAPADIEKKASLYKKFGLLRWEDGKDHNLPQDFADMLGWSELARKVDAVYDSIPDKTHTLVYCDNYGMAGAVNYYSKHKNINAVSMNADYINWFPPSTADIKNLILVKDTFDTDPGRTKEKSLFKYVALKGAVENMYARENGTRVYVLTDATVPIMPFFTKEIEERKQRK
ncbi:MAG: glycosyltransferase family 39 protein [Ferruginibacter sp.]